MGVSPAKGEPHWEPGRCEAFTWRTHGHLPNETEIVVAKICIACTWLTLHMLPITVAGYGRQGFGGRPILSPRVQYAQEGSTPAEYTYKHETT